MSGYKPVDTILHLLEQPVPPMRRKLHRPLLEFLDAGFGGWWENARYPGDVTHEHIALYLVAVINEDLRLISRLRQDWDAFKANYGYALTESDRLNTLLEAARSLGSTEAEVQKDREAAARWFGQDAINERFLRRTAEAEQRVAFSVELLGAVAGSALSGADDCDDSRRIWGRLNLERTVQPLLLFDGDVRVRCAAMQALADALQGGLGSKKDEQPVLISEEIAALIVATATDRSQPLRMQVAAFGMLPQIPVEVATELVRSRLLQPLPDGDDLFVRKYAVDALGGLLERGADLKTVLCQVVEDPSEHVRQALVRLLPEYSPQLFNSLLQNDPAPSVKGVALMILRYSSGCMKDEFRLQALKTVFRSEQDNFVLRCGLLVCVEAAEQMADAGDQQRLQLWLDTLKPLMEELHVASAHLAVRRWAAQAFERLWVLASPERYLRYRALLKFVSDLELKQWRKLPAELAEPDELPRMMALIAQGGMPLSLKWKRGCYRIHKGYRFGFRWWRFFYELLHPSPDKRQAFRHTVGRYFDGDVRAPSGLLGEVSPTKVPGEPLYMDEEGGWRPYLPLPDDLVACSRLLSGAKPVKLVTSEGITEILAPRSLVARLQAAFKLSLEFERVARLRNWQADSQHSPDEYIKALTEFGFNISFTPHSTNKSKAVADPSVRRFFPLAIPFVDQAVQARIADYFFSVFENTIDDLAVFCLALLLIFLFERVWLHGKARNARGRMPLVVGGWGTRGKSGTERLKGALFTALGCSVLSKTTGCEAMVLHAHRFGELREMFIFRPYDKATIWEQHNLLTLADQLNVDVMLWECMGLNPTYVGILQNTWMKDDLSTITNAYPDHEDIQGPAGINIPEVMINFIPKGSSLITTEEQMLPVLEEGARQVGTSLESINWLQAGLLPRDLLQRFPYDEHPYNVALALALAARLGMSPDMAMKEMADRVVPDLGVLKTYPAANVLDRKLQFINGMSANDRYGCLANWKRTGLNLVHPDTQPGNWVCLVVNNRADRIARSKVFAGILVEDICADRIVLIGSNLKGLRGYIEQALDQQLAELSLWPEQSGSHNSGAGRILSAAAERNRVATSQEQLLARLKAMLGGSGVEEAELDGLTTENATAFVESLKTQGYPWSDAVFEHAERDFENYSQYRELLNELEQVETAGRAVLDARFREIFKGWFIDRIVLVEDYYTTGEQLINTIATLTPPGYLNRIMGLQNIKGTGLDFVYRWQAWNQCYQACKSLFNPDPSVYRAALSELSSFQSFGLLSERYVTETVAAARSLPHAQNEEFQASLDVTISELENAMREVRQGLLAVRRNGFIEWMVDTIESFLDAGDSITRSKTAKKIYRDLVDERISRQRAAAELQALTLRQKGGWLMKQLLKLKRLTRRGYSSQTISTT